MLDHNVADAFGTQTKRINEAVSRNPSKFTDEHCFKLSANEWELLRSHDATSKKKRGGARYAPHACTIKGIARLATILDTPQALAATDLIIDTFVTVFQQVNMAASNIAISNKSALTTNAEDERAIQAFRTRLFSALNALLDTVIDPERDRTLREVSQKIGSEALKHVEERLRSKGLQNAKLEADTSLVLAETEKLLADARKINAEAATIDMQIIEQKISIVKQLIKMSEDLEPTHFLKLLGSFENATPLIAQKTSHLLPSTGRKQT